MITSRRFKEGENTLPTFNGSIIGILQYNDGFYIRIRTTTDVEGMEAERCNVLENASLVSIDELQQYAASLETIEDNIKIKGIVTSDATTGNISANTLILQEESTGAEIRLTAPHNIPLHSSIEIALRGAVLEYDELGMVISNIPNSQVLAVEEGAVVEPISISLNEVSSYNYNNILVQVNNFQFEDLTQVYAENNVLTNCEISFTISLFPESSFIGTNVKSGSGNVVFIPLRDRLYVRNEADFKLDKPYEDCSLQYTSEFVFISEIADPDNTSTASNLRFIELYNASSEEVDLNGWQLRRYTNDNTEFTERSVIDLSGNRISSGSTFLIAADSLAFESVYGFKPDLEGGTGGAADSNGDDNIELLDGNGVVVDVFGVPGEDGSGTNHEFEDGRAVRNTSVIRNNSVYTFSEWTIYNDTGAAGTTNLPQQAPQDFSAGIR
ncbi:lamin tail domain-containing protein [Galbibacter sp. BG1]|nr:lamin tail domain-containing protein [Galbibacter sp. BG1]